MGHRDSSFGTGLSSPDMSKTFEQPRNRHFTVGSRLGQVSYVFSRFQEIGALY
jgi:hypothetical protein